MPIKVHPQREQQIFCPDDLYGAHICVELHPKQIWFAKLTKRYIYVNHGGARLRLTRAKFSKLFEEDTNEQKQN